MRPGGEGGVRRVIGWMTAHPLCYKSRGICLALWLPACSPARELSGDFRSTEPCDKQGFFFFIIVSGFLSCSFYLLCIFPAVSPALFGMQCTVSHSQL